MKRTSISGLGGLIAATVVAFFIAGRAEAGFTGTDLFVPGVARTSGVGGSEFYSTVWITNVSSSPASIRIALLQLGSANPAPVTRTDVIPANETRRYDNIVGSLFGLTGTGGALHILSDQELLVSSRTYNDPASLPLKDTDGLSFSAVRADLAVGANQSRAGSLGSHLHSAADADPRPARRSFAPFRTPTPRSG